MKREQLTVPGTDPVEPHPEIRTRLDNWLRARDDERDAKDRSKRYHDELLDAITAAGIPYYTYDADGKRKRVFATVGDPKLKTTTVASLEPKRGRRGRDKDVALPIDKEREKAVSLLSDPAIKSIIDNAFAEFGDDIESVTVTSGGHRETVEHRKVPRKDVVSDKEREKAVAKLSDNLAIMSVSDTAGIMSAIDNVCTGDDVEPMTVTIGDYRETVKEREKAVSLLSDPAIKSIIDNAFAEFGDDIESVTVTSGGHRETVEHRKVPRKDVVADEDPFARVRGLVDGDGAA